MRNSLFERLYLLCIQNNWSHAYAQLSHQGRMHADIMKFPNQHFYGGSLKVLPKIVDPTQKQISILNNGLNVASNLEKVIFENRTVFISTPVDENSNLNKTNLPEAELAAKIAAAFKRLYESKNDLTPESIGIITPYRAQIAQIKQAVQKFKIDEELITVDTVERYQGGARKVIIISLCVNEISQLKTLVSLSSEGVDRKLNVAMTRAREHLIILGNESLLRMNPLYHQMIEQFTRP